MAPGSTGTPGSTALAPIAWRAGVARLGDKRSIVACSALAFTLIGIALVNPPSVIGLAYYFALWSAGILLLHRAQLADFAFAFVVSAAFITAYYLVQTTVYPDSFGTTSPQGSWTDDSYFFALAADSIPTGLWLRDNYFLYAHSFTTFVRSLTPFSIEHPMDVIFFQAGIAALLSTFSKRLAWQLTADAKLSKTVYAMTLVCPFLMMNGGVIFIRDTPAAALLVYSLCGINDRTYVRAAGAVVLQIALRPGTGLILLPVYLVVYFATFKALARRHPLLATVIFTLVPLAGFGAIVLLWDSIVGLAPEFFAGLLFSGSTVDAFGREIIDDLVADPGANTAFLAVQELPFVVKAILNGAYIFLYPFLSFRYAFPGDYFDLRAISLNLVNPIYAFWLNAWFIAGAMTSRIVARRQRAIVVAFVLALLLIGTYSMQTRHKTILYPLYYLVVAIGFLRASPGERRLGYGCSGGLLTLQVAFALR